MFSANGQCSLFIHPVSSTPSLKSPSTNDLSPLISLLRTIDFISDEISSDLINERENLITEAPIKNTNNSDVAYLSFYTGEKFLNYVSYMGCAPTVQFEASDDKREFCFVRLHFYDTAKLIHSKKQASAPHCPNCNKPVKNWQQQLTIAQPTTIHCGSCNTASNIKTYNWRKMAGYSHLFIEITDIFPKEAIPQSSLLSYLTENSNTDWQYFYSCN